MRCAALVLGLLTATLKGWWDPPIAAGALALLLVAIWRTFRPLEFVRGRVETTVALVAELGINVAVVLATGWWHSPFVFCLLTGIIAAAFATGFGGAARAAVITIGVVSASYYTSGGRSTLGDTAQWAVELLLVAMVAAYARNLFGQVEEQRSRAIDRMSRLSEANVLLTSLHGLAQTLPASLDLAEVLASTLPRLREVIEFSAGAVLLRDHTTQQWSVVAAEGMRLGRTLNDAQLPAPLRVATTGTQAWLEPRLSHESGPGLDAFSRSGLYAPLRARGTLIGVIALEHHEPDRFNAHDRALLGGFADPAALAIDNARWFGRLRTVGAHEERSRIARDLHDRVGQSLAYLAFQLDRLVTRSHNGEPVETDLTGLREDVRGVIGEVRETLFDLRTEVTEERGLGDTLASYLHRIQQRTRLEVSFRRDEQARIALPREREIWRIAQEAITNAERHAGATTLTVTWECTPHHATLTVSDNGRGFAVGDAGRVDSYGLLGMRERADAIGARLDVMSTPGGGTVVECRVGAS